MARPERPFRCIYPGCSASFASLRGLRIHRTLAGHQRIVDSVEAHDGDADRPGPAHPKLRDAAAT